MRIRNRSQGLGTCAALAAVIIASALTTGPALAKKKKVHELPEVTHDGLELLPDRKVAAAWVKPGADFSTYDRILILDTYVAFKKNWVLMHNSGSVQRVTNRDVERMKRDMAELFREVFVKALDTEGGYPVVESADTDVLLLRPGIIDLDVTAPDLKTASRTYSYAASAGEATLYLELFDSVSGEILARVLDRKTAGNRSGFMQWTNAVSNRAAAEEILGEWAGLLKKRLDEVHGKERD